MPCYNPLHGYTTPEGGFQFRATKTADTELTIPCGHCIGCRIRRSREWTLRILHEASQSTPNYFVTLTYADAPISLRYRDFQLFMKRLRKSHGSVRFFVVGEYGEQFSRPHFHAILFGLQLDDLRAVSQLSGKALWRSAKLEKLWGHGFVTLGTVTMQSAGYVSRYVLKKITGPDSERHYRIVDADGVVHPVTPEFCRMSLRPGLGSTWLDRFTDDAYTHDYIVHNGRKYPVPKYYDRRKEKTDPDKIAAIKEERAITALRFMGDNHHRRLAVREEVAKARLSTLKRNYDTK